MWQCDNTPTIGWLEEIGREALYVPMSNMIYWQRKGYYGHYTDGTVVDYDSGGEIPSGGLIYYIDQGC